MGRKDLKELRREVCRANRMLPLCGLVTMHSGNASGLDRASGRLLIKPSGMDYEKLTPEKTRPTRPAFTTCLHASTTAHCLLTFAP